MSIASLLRSPWAKAGRTLVQLLASLGLLVMSLSHVAMAQPPTTSRPPLKPAAPQATFSGEVAYDYLKQICRFGPRPSGSEGMRNQQEALRKFFEQLGAQVEFQTFRARHPGNGGQVDMSNMIIHWHPERRERILFCAHYDTRPYPDRDARNPRGVFIGANDGGSGVAVLCELGRHIPAIDTKYGVDFVLFDGEELVFSERDPYFVGSEYFARDYVANKKPYQYRAGILLDMVGDADLQLYREINSMTYARDLTLDIWSTAKKLGVREFIHRNHHKIRDDHLPLNKIAKIPTVDIIDFDYPSSRARTSYWHTTQDSIDKCSAASLGKVGHVITEWLKNVE